MVDRPEPEDRPARRAPTGWKRHPVAMWAFLAIGAGRIIVTGIGLVLFGRNRG